MRAPLQREHDWHGRSVTVMGLGLFGGGLGAAAFALRMGAHVTVTDQRDAGTLAESVAALEGLPHADRIRLVLGEHKTADFADADIVIVNPAVPPHAPFVRMAREGGARVTSAIELLLGGLACRVVAITGTHGKSSTVHFTADLLRASMGPDVRIAVGGNIGGSLLSEIETFQPDDVVVLELSSYQLEHLSDSFLARTDLERVLDVAAITTIGVDHLERHGTVAGYRAAKLRIAGLTGQGGSDPGTVLAPAEEASGLPKVSRLVLHGGSTQPTEVEGGSTLAVPGVFQRQNLALALAIGNALGADADAMRRAIPHLTGLPHRMERLARPSELADGRTLCIHDNGVSTTPESTLAALESLGTPEGTRLLFVGGQAKRGSDMAELARVAQRLGWTLVPFGAAAGDLAEAARGAGAALAGEGAGQIRDEWPAGVEEAVREAMAGPSRARLGGPVDSAGSGQKSSPGALHVLFSPACASFDRYPNFRARALAFRAAMAAAACESPTGKGPATEHPEAKH